MTKNSFFTILFILNTIMIGYNTYSIYNLNKDAAATSIAVNNLTLDTKGKIADILDNQKKLSEQKQTTVIKKEIVYTSKESNDDADIELKTEKPKITVKVNDGQRYGFDLLPTESSKFEDGKLIISQGFSTNINIKANEVKRSRWSISTALNSDKDILGGIHYELGKTVSASVYMGQGIKPYYGLTYKIGGYE